MPVLINSYLGRHSARTWTADAVCMHIRATRYWRRGAMPGMDAFAAVSLLATLFLVSALHAPSWLLRRSDALRPSPGDHTSCWMQVRAAAAHPPAAAADAMTPTDYWRAVLPETPMPRAILDLLTTSTGIFNLLQIHTVSAFCFPFNRPSKTRYF